MARLSIKFKDGTEEVIEDAICVKWEENDRLWIEMENDYADVPAGTITDARGHWVSSVVGYSVEEI